MKTQFYGREFLIEGTMSEWWKYLLPHVVSTKAIPNTSLRTVTMWAWLFWNIYPHGYVK